MYKPLHRLYCFVIFTVVCLIGVLPNQVDAIIPVSLSSDATDYLLSPENFQYQETGPNTQWEDILDEAYSSNWKAPDVSTLNVSSPNKAVWVRIPLENKVVSEGDYILEIIWPQLQRVEMRQFSYSRFSPIQKAGQSYPPSDVTSPDKNLVFTVKASNDDQSYIYLKIINKNFIFLPMMVMPSDVYKKKYEYRLIIFSVSLGILIVMALYNLMLSFFTKDKIYLFYAITVFSILFYVLAVTGYGRLYLWGSSPLMVEKSYLFFAALAFLSTCYFFRVFLRLDYYGGWLLRINDYFLMFWLLMLMLSLMSFESALETILLAGGMVTTILGMPLAIYVWLIKANPSAKFFFFSWLGINIATLIALLVMIGAVNYFSSFEYMQTMSFVLEVILLSVALAENISREREEKELAQAEVIDQKSSILIMQEKANVELEKNVRSRTLELARTLTDLERANEELARVSTVDALTQLYNRGYFDEAAKAEIARSSRTRASMSMILIDVDHFKQVNDTYGHVVGDKCLTLIAQALREVVSRASDVVARYGGEEFAVILPDTIEKNALIVAERIRKNVSEIAFINDGETIKLTVSLGVVGRTIVQGDTVEGFVNAADTALYMAKDNGRNRVETNVLAVRR